MTTTQVPRDVRANSDVASALRRERDALLLRLDQRQTETLERFAVSLAREGLRRIALFGAGPHTTAFAREPWEWAGLQVVAILDDDPRREDIDGIPVVRPAHLQHPIDVIIVSSEGNEPALFQAAVRSCAQLKAPVRRIYTDAPDAGDDEALVERLIRDYALSPGDAAWLVLNRWERHDASLPMLHHSRTTLHKRRYRFAAMLARRDLGSPRVVADAACGTGYGSAMLSDLLAASRVIGIDIDPRSADYAARRHGAGRPGVEFRVGDARHTGIDAGSGDLVCSFETIEHLPEPQALLREFARILRPGGMLIISTPNDTGLTDYHEISYTVEAFESALQQVFGHVAIFGQLAAGMPRHADLPPGIYPLSETSPRPHTIIAVARRP